MTSIMGISSALATPGPQSKIKMPHGLLTIPCMNCHTSSGWKPIRPFPDFDHGKTRFPIQGRHKDADCRQCHPDLNFSQAGTQCVDCHADIHRRQFGSDCEECHNMSGWRVELKDINEHQNRFPLMGAHAAVQCEGCHKSAAVGLYRGLSTDCVFCHLADYQNAEAVDHVAAGYDTQCETCHGMDSWSQQFGGHTQSTSFPLTGAHAQLDCRDCHANNVYTGSSADCISCHLEDYNRATDPNHVRAGYPRDCSPCHSTATWESAFDGHSAAQFQLTGAHQSLQCSDCHSSGQYAGLPTTCISCHQTQFNQTSDPGHVAAGFPQDCTICHSTTAWLPSPYNHTTTEFRLTGAHEGLQCSDCHSIGQYEGLPGACISCHRTQYNNTIDPAHAAAGFPEDCSACHSTTAWSPAPFNHAATAFPLTEAHGNLQCSDCHKNGQYAELSTTCISCHQSQYSGTTNPNHAAAGYSEDCTLCHSTASWDSAPFNHTTTGFTLSGAHAGLQCSDCHGGGQYAGLSATCVSCHQTEYSRTTSPYHEAAGFPKDCSICHSTTAWIPAFFTHPATELPLTGAHARLQCSDCHRSGQYTGLRIACISCHQAQYNSAANPDHAASGFPQDCTACHSTTAWTPASFNHSTTAFPLTGAHGSLQCSDCHGSGQYSGLPITCISCHQSQYNGTTNPDHASAGFPQDCTACHSTTAWAPASFNHSTTAFPLTGAHASVECSNCHLGGVYGGTPTDCYSCHSNEYNSVTNPSHIGAGFSRDCSSCHSTSTWAGASFNHTAFPIYSGSHAGRWDTCGDCHTSSSSYGVFSCINCHAHNQTSTDQQHSGVSGYVYNGTICYGCHQSSRD